MTSTRWIKPLRMGKIASSRAKFAANSSFIHRSSGNFQSAAGIRNGRRKPPIPPIASGPEIWRGSGSG